MADINNNINMGQPNMNQMGMGMMNNMNNMQQTMFMNNMQQGNMMMNNPMMMNPMMMNTMMGNTMMGNTMMGNMNPMMMNTMAGNMNPMMMNNMGMGMMNNPNMMNQMMNILNNSQNMGQNDNNGNNINDNNINNIPNNVQVPDLTEKIKKEEEEKKKKLIKQIINKESGGQPAKHCKELETISDMAIMGSITKNYIEVDSSQNPNKYIKVPDALKSNEQYYFVLGILAEYLSKQGVTTAIEKKDQNQLSKEKLKEIDTFLQFLINGLSNLKKHELRFEFGWEKDQLILTDIKEQEDFLDELRVALAHGFNIKTNQIVITYPRSGSVLVTIAFRTEDYNNITVDQLKGIFQQHAPNLNKIIGIESNLVLDGILLNPELLDSKGNNLNQGWGVGEKRGGRPYYPPSGWLGYGLKVLGKYDKGNNNWISYNGGPGEWCIAYHGATQKNNNNYIKMRDEDDTNHPGNKVGEGVCCSDKPDVLDSEGGIIQVGNKKYIIGFMLRVRPDKIRIAKSNPHYWVLNGISSEIRPYRILIKKI